MLLFKIIGLLAVFSVCCLWGFSKSSALRMAERRSYFLVRSCSALAEYIRLDKGEIVPLVKTCFDNNYIIVSGDKISPNRNTLNNSEAEILAELFDNIGMQDISAEYDRTKLYAALLEKQHQSAEEKYKTEGKLYNTLGLLGGVFIILFLI